MRSVFKIIVGVTLLTFAGQALANLAADHIIRNSVIVDYNDAGGVDQDDVTVSVDITVNLVQASPTLAVDSTNTFNPDPVSTNETVTLAFFVTSNANGVDTYALTNPSLTPSLDTSVSSTPADFDLGGTTFAGGTDITSWTTGSETDGDAAGTEVVVPADSDGTDSEVNGFVQGDTIVVTTGVVCEVNAVVEPASGSEPNATASIWVDNCSSSSGTLSAGAGGAQIGERTSIQVQIATGNTDGTTTFDAEIDFDGAATPQTVSGALGAGIDIVILGPDLRVYKFVRNLSGNNPTTSCGVDDSGSDGPNLSTNLSCLVVDSTTYYAEGVTTDPGEVLEYAILIINAGGKAEAILAEDDVVAFTSFTGSSSINLVPRDISPTPTPGGASSCYDTSTPAHTCTIDEVAVTATIGDGPGGDWGELDAGTVKVSAGHDGSGNAISGDFTAGGELEPDEASVVLFNVEVD